MRFRSEKINGFQVFAVTGINTVSFAIDRDNANLKGLLGFAVEKTDHTRNKTYFMYGFKVFEEIHGLPEEHKPVSTKDHPIQSFVWDDFTGRPGYDYTYKFLPVRGKPGQLTYDDPVVIDVKMEEAFSSATHDVFFNRGVASSQAYIRRFNNKKPSELTGEKQQEAYEWLARDLDNAMIKFIDNATKNDALRGCFYEFHYAPVLEAYKRAIDRGVDVKIIIDAKKNGDDEKAAFPREANLKSIKAVGIPMANIVLREASENNIQHNKFCVLLKGGAKTPTEVWSGSTNISEGGIYGQTNVGHWVKEPEVARQYSDYWTLLSGDPGMQEGDSRSKRSRDNKAFKQEVMKLTPSMEPDDIPTIKKGVTCFFSPRIGSGVLNTYAHLVDKAEFMSGVTLAFGISAVFKDLIKDNTPEDQVIFMLLEKKDRKRWNQTKPFVPLTSKENNVYQAYGSRITDKLYRWTRETNTQFMGLNSHVKYVHSKFLLHDPLSEEPVIVTGSANFSDPSTNSNDENMLMIKGNLRVADIYFTEFNRLFNHYYFRSVYTDQKFKKKKPEKTWRGFLDPTDGWVKKNKEGTFKSKRVKLYSTMQGFTDL